MAKERRPDADQTPVPPPKTLKELGLEAWDALEIHRSELKNAPYNPRLIGEAEKRKLKAGLQRHGHVAGITWNKRTGNIVGGHQRIDITDAIAGTNDYRLTVSAIDVDEGREKELNLLLNNQNAQGDFDLDMLAQLVKSPDIDLSGTGFDHADLYRLFGDTPILARNENLEALAGRVREAQQRYNAIEKKNQGKNSDEFYAVVVFRDADQCARWIKACGLPENRYQSGEEVARLCGVLAIVTGPAESG